MRQKWSRFNLRTILVLMLGIAVGFSLNEPRLNDWIGSFSARPAVASVYSGYIVEPSDILDIQVNGRFSQAYPSVVGHHIVEPDGRMNLGSFGSVFVERLTLAETSAVVRQYLSKHVTIAMLSVDVFAQNSKRYYVITRSAAGRDNIVSFPYTGNETVLDAVVATRGGVPQGSSLTVVRPITHGTGSEQLLAVDWQSITKGRSTTTNYSLWPGDRLVIE